MANLAEVKSNTVTKVAYRNLPSVITLIFRSKYPPFPVFLIAESKYSYSRSFSSDTF